MVGKIAVIIFIVEAIIMVILSQWFTAVPLTVDLFDAALLTITGSPVIYAGVVRPFVEAARDANARLENQLEATRELLEQNEKLGASLQSFSEATAGIHERTLQKIGADLHDGPAQLLTFALLQVDRLTPSIAGAGDPRNMEIFGNLRDVVDKTLLEVRGISTGLSLPELNSATLIEAIQLSVKRHEETTRTSVPVLVSGTVGAVPDSLKTCAYRFVQEALSNAYKHARSATTRVEVALGPNVTISVVDDGHGFDISRSSTAGLGITGMRARVLALRGVLDIVSTPGDGTRLTASFPSSLTQAGAS